MALKLDPIWVKVNCKAGPCRAEYVVNARTAPVWGGKPYCRRCWERANKLNAQLGWTVYDCPEGTWPDPDSEDPFERGEGAVPFVKGMKLL
jgi:hypothetical protein